MYQKLRVDNRSEAKLNRASFAHAFQLIFDSIPLLGTISIPKEITSGQDLPCVFHLTYPWMLGFHASHHFYVAGGCIFCTLCGFVATGRKQSGLEQPCRKSIPIGSKGRVRALLRGSCKGCGWKAWPNGLPGSTLIPPKRLKKPQKDPTGGKPADLITFFGPTCSFAGSSSSASLTQSAAVSQQLDCEDAGLDLRPFFWL